jgi:hypothetical protein
MVRPWGDSIVLGLDENHPIRLEARREQHHRLGLKALLAVFLPLAIALLAAFTPALFTHHGLFPVLISWIALLVFHGIVWWNAYPNESSVLPLTVEISDLARERERLSSLLDDAEKWVFHSYAASALRTMTAAYVRTGFQKLSDIREAAGEMLAPLYLHGGEVLGFEPSERWTFGVYLYSKKRDELVPLWREKSRNHPSDGRGRAWGRGQGHVGKAFVDRKVIVTGDAAHPDVVQLCGAPANLERGYDREVYRSFASVPIGPIDGDSEPYGVLVGTSDRKDRFDADAALLLMHYADSIAVMIALGQVDFDCMLEGAEPYLAEWENRNGEEGQPERSGSAEKVSD